MPLDLMTCRLCTRSRPEFRQAIDQLANRYQGQLAVIELDCMAACDDVPAVMIETDYYAKVAPCALIALIDEMLAPEPETTTS
ncbi:MAG: hypothetical protein HC822_13810 [Oscillochloris sp.]|nr:hypothetical protein [Oscillochloris sp.]